MLELIARLVPKPAEEPRPKAQAQPRRRGAGRALSGAATRATSSRSVDGGRSAAHQLASRHGGARAGLARRSAGSTRPAFARPPAHRRRRGGRPARRPRRRHRPAAARPGPPARRAPVRPRRAARERPRHAATGGSSAGAGGEGDLDLDLTLEVAGGRPEHADELVTRRWTAPQARAVSARRPQRLDAGPRGRAGRDGRRRGRPDTLRARQHERDRLRRRRARAPAPGRVAARRPRSSTTCSRCAARAAPISRWRCARRPRELAREPAAERLAIVLSDCRATAGGDPLGRARRPRSRSRPGHERGPGCRRGGPGARRSRARAILTGHPFLGAPSRACFRSLSEVSVESSGRMAGLTKPLIAGYRRPHSGCIAPQRGEVRPTMLRSVNYGSTQSFAGGRVAVMPSVGRIKQLSVLGVAAAVLGVTAPQRVGRQRRVALGLPWPGRRSLERSIRSGDAADLSCSSADDGGRDLRRRAPPTALQPVAA